MKRKPPNKKLRLLLYFCIAVAVFFGVYVLYNNLSQNYNPATADTKETNQATNAEQTTLKAAPSFTVFDYNEEKINLSDKFGKPLVVNFWATWCPPCVNELPEFQKMHQKYGDSIEFMMVNLTDGIRETKNSALTFIKEKQYTFPVYFDTLQSATSTYNIYSIPMTLFIDKNGNIKNVQIGQMSRVQLEQKISEIIN